MGHQRCLLRRTASGSARHSTSFLRRILASLCLQTPDYAVVCQVAALSMSALSCAEMEVKNTAGSISQGFKFPLHPCHGGNKLT